jgi:anti-sigma factor RsiW
MKMDKKNKRCDLDQEKLFAYFDCELSVQDQHRTEQHLHHCKNCADRLREVKQVKEWLGLVTPPPLSPYFAKRVAAELRIDRRPKRISWILGTVSVVLVLLIGNLTGGILAHRNNFSPAEPISRYYRLSSFDALPESSLGNAYLSILEVGHE